METITDLSASLKGLYLLENKEVWRFLFTKHSNIKKAVTKTGAPKEYPLGKTSFIVTEGRNYSECLKKAKNSEGFNDNQLLGSRQIE